jgi:hypothetical protein
MTAKEEGAEAMLDDLDQSPELASDDDEDVSVVSDCGNESSTSAGGKKKKVCLRSSLAQSAAIESLAAGRCQHEQACMHNASHSVEEEKEQEKEGCAGGCKRRRCSHQLRKLQGSYK